MPGEMEVTIHVAAILPTDWEPPHPFVDGAFLDPEAGIGSQLQVEWIVKARHFMRTVPKRDLDHMERNVGTRFHVQPKIVKAFPSPLPAVRVRIHRNNV